MILYLDEDLRNADWTKRTWDLWIGDGKGGLKLVGELYELLDFLRVGDETDADKTAALIDFKHLPVYDSAPAKLKSAVEKFLK